MPPKIKVLDNVEGLARSICLPGSTAPQRYPSFPALERTAILAFNTPGTWLVPGTGATAASALAFRQAAYPLWLKYQQASWGMMASFALDPATYQVVSQLEYAGTGNQTVTGVNSIPIMVAGSTPWGQPLLAIDEGTGPLPWMYCIGNGTVAYVSTSVIPTAAWPSSIIYEVWRAPGRFDTYEMNVNGQANFAESVFPMTNSETVWMRIKSVNFDNFATTATRYDATLTLMSATGTYSYSGTGPATVTITGTGAASYAMVPFTAPVEFANTTLPWANTKVTAVSALFTNVTKIQNKEGTVLWGRLNPSLVNPWAAAEADIKNLHPSEKAFLPLETGCYTYVAPSTDMGTFLNYTISSGSGAKFPLFSLGNDALYHLGWFSDPDGGTNLAVNLDWHIEFRSSSTLFTLGYSQLPVEALHQAQLKLVSSGFFYKNDVHERILSAVAKALKLTSRWSGTLGLLADGIQAGAHLGQMIVSNRPKRQMKATSAQASGWLRGTEKPRRRKGQRTPPAPQAKQAKPKMKSGLQMYLDTRKK